MIKRYDHPVKRRLWRPRLRRWLGTVYNNRRRRSELSVVCLPGCELDEVTEIYDQGKLGVRQVICVERDISHFERMKDVKKERIKQGKNSPELVLVKDDVREYLRTTKDKHDIIFLDFDGNDHLVVEECGRLISGRGLLPETGGVFGVNVLGARERFEQQLAIRARAGKPLSEEERKILLIESAIARDPIIADMVGGRRIIPRPQVNSKHDLQDARGVFYTNLVLRSMFRGRGLEELTEKLAEDKFLNPRLMEYSEHASKQLAQVFNLTDVDEEHLIKRIMQLVAEVAMFDISEVKQQIINHMEYFLHNVPIQTAGDDLVRVLKLDSQKCLHYLAAKTLGPWLCTKVLKLKYTWGSFPMLTDAGFFIPVSNFEDKLTISFCKDEQCTHKPHITITIPDGTVWQSRDSKSIRRIVTRLEKYRKEFEVLLEEGREVLELDPEDLDPTLPVLTSKEQLKALVRENPLITSDEIFDRYNVLILDRGKILCKPNEVWAIIFDTLKGMGRDLPVEEKKRERSRIKLAARMDLGWSDDQLQKEFYTRQEFIGQVRGEIVRGDYKEGGSKEHLIPYITDEKRRVHTQNRSDMVREKGEGPTSCVYSDFSYWIDNNIANSPEMKRLKVGELQRMHEADMELITADQKEIKRILTTFSEFEPYEINPVELLVIAGALKKLDAGQGELELLERIAEVARFRLEAVIAPEKGVPNHFNSYDKRKNKLMIHFGNRNLLFAGFAYNAIRSYSSRKIKEIRNG
jgi:hypothetical protein